jgi:hypothetical protein
MSRFARAAATVFTTVGLGIAIAPSAGAATAAQSGSVATVSAVPTTPAAVSHYYRDCDYDWSCWHDDGWYWYHDDDDDCWRWYHRGWDHEHYWHYYRDHDSRWGYHHHNGHR